MEDLLNHKLSSYYMFLQGHQSLGSRRIDKKHSSQPEECQPISANK